MIAVIDYDAGNIKSVEKALQFLGEEVVVTRDTQVLLSADKVILPGVGAFGDAMKKLNDYGLTKVIKNVISKGTPFLGICLGLQLLFDSSEEAPGVKGLGILPGRIVRFDYWHKKIQYFGVFNNCFRNTAVIDYHFPDTLVTHFVYTDIIFTALRGAVA